MTDHTARLRDLGDALQAAVAADLAAAPRRRRRRGLIAAGAISVALAGTAAATTLLVDGGSVARSMPAGTLALAGTEPTCTVVRDGVEFDCTLAKPPAPEVNDWTGTVEPTVDANRVVNGGCRALNAAGTHWTCYLGQEAVRQAIIGQGLLGQPSPAPGAG
ncbi:MAG: hypothetical protein U0Y82_07505 [Thermoleophilia bacterium]